MSVPRINSEPPAVAGVALQVGHRVGTIGLVGLVAAVYLMCVAKPFAAALAAAVGAADVGLCGAVLAMSFVDRRRPAWREAWGLVWFNGAVLAVAVPLMILDRTNAVPADLQDRVTSVREAAAEWLAPNPLPPE